MSEKQPYSSPEDKFGELPLPDAQASWKKMEKLLDDEDGGRRVPPFLVLRSCLPWAALLLVLGVAVGLWFYPPSEWDGKETRIGQQAEDRQSGKQLPADRASGKEGPSLPTADPLRNGAPEPSTGRSDRVDHADRTSSPSNADPSTDGHSPMRSDAGVPTRPGQVPAVQTGPASARPPLSSRAAGTVRKSVSSGRGSGPTSTNGNSPSRPVDGRKEGRGTSVQHPTSGNRGRNSNPPDAAPQKSGDTPSDASRKPSASSGLTVAKSDTTQGAVPQLSPADSSRVDTATQKAGVNKKTASAKKIVISAGVGLQQGIPISDQKTVPYSYYGRKSSLSDYVPSVWVKAAHGKWFLMGEFRYGAAQSVKEFAFSRKTTWDTAQNSLTETSYRLMKTYYHQIPLTVNYHLKPNWSVGVGGMYSVFHGAITEREVRSTNLQTQAQTVSKQIVPIKQFTDSFLYRTQVHLLLQTDVHWKRFSLGLRYAWDVQPFIRYTTPTGDLKEEKNQSLQAILRYRLWKSR